MDVAGAERRLRVGGVRRYARRLTFHDIRHQTRGRSRSGTGPSSCSGGRAAPDAARPPSCASSAHGGESPPLQDDAPLRLGKATPDPERLAGLQRELPAEVHHRAAVADLLRPARCDGPATGCARRPDGRTPRCPCHGTLRGAATARRGPSGRGAGKRRSCREPPRRCPWARVAPGDRARLPASAGGQTPRSTRWTPRPPPDCDGIATPRAPRPGRGVLTGDGPARVAR